MVYVLIAAVIAVIAGVYYFVIRPGTMAATPEAPADGGTRPQGSPPRADLYEDDRSVVGSDAPVVPSIIAATNPYNGESVAPMGKTITSTGATITVPTGLLAQLQTGVGGSLVLPTDDQLIKSGVTPAQVGAVQAKIILETIDFQRLASGDPTVQPCFWDGSPIYDANGYRNPDPIVPAGNPNFIAGTAGMPIGATYNPVTKSWYVRG
jgi:hypothetical protein